MNKYRREIIKELDKLELNYREVDDVAIEICVRGEICQRINITVVFFDKLPNLVSIAATDILSVNGKRKEALELINEINNTTRWFTLSADKNDCVNCSVDTFLSEEGSRFEFNLMLVYLIKVIDENYSKFMKLLWN